MKTLSLFSLFAAALLTASTLSAAAPLEPKFRAQDIDTAVSIGYGIAIADVDGDGKPELVYKDSRNQYVYAKPDPARPTDMWIARPISQPAAHKPKVAVTVTKEP